MLVLYKAWLAMLPVCPENVLCQAMQQLLCFHYLFFLILSRGSISEGCMSLSMLQNLPCIRTSCVA